jgi:prepilin-type N-terminal cleavage/methylation domain-containing protein
MVRFRADVSRPDTSPNRHSAFTLIEIMVAMALFAIVMTTVGPNMRRSSVSTKGAALALAAALTEARQQAITQQVPVALVIPSDNGSQGQANSYYIAAGEQPRVTQVKRLGGEQSDLRLMVGHWPLDTSKLADPTLITTIAPPPEATWENDFDLNLWGLPDPNDYAFIFTPRGKLLTNDLPHFDGAYHLVVSHGGRSTPASVPGTGVMTTQPTMHSLTQVGSPYTVTIDPAGSISVSPGLVAMAVGGVTVKDQAALATPPDPPALATPPSSAPVVTSVTLLPDPSKLDLPAGVNMILTPDRHMTMTVRARSPERVPLFCQWEATDGGLSSPEEVRASYLPQTQEWQSVWQWRFPAETDAGDQISLKGVVKDAYGNEAPVGLGAGAADPFVVEAGDAELGKLFSSNRDGDTDLYAVKPDGTGLTNLTKTPGWDAVGTWSPDRQRIVFSSNRTGGGEVFTMNADGTGPTRLTVTGNDGNAVWSPDGGRVAFSSARTGNWEVFVMNADGTGQTNLSNSWRPDQFTVWSPNGNRLLYQSQFGVKTSIFVVNSDGSGNTRLTNSGGSETDYVWSPDGTRIAFRSDQDGNYEVYVMNADGTGQTNLTNIVGTDGRPRWSPDGTRIVFESTRTGNAEVYVMNADGTGQTNLTNTAGNDNWPEWSPDGSQIFFWSQRDGNYEIYVMSSDGSQQVNLSESSAYDQP